MRMDLHFQSLQLRLGQLGGQSGSLRLLFTKSAVVIESVSNDQGGPVNRKSLVKVVRAKRIVAPKDCERGLRTRLT
jgi:hypothetical protein